MDVPIYMGSMVLSDMETAYRYETWLSKILDARIKKYTSKYNYGFFVGMQAVFRQEKKSGKYKDDDFHPIPDDPLVCLPYEYEWVFDMLSLKRKHLNILEYKVFKYFRQKKCYPA